MRPAMDQTWRLGRTPTPPHYEQARDAEPNRYSVEGGQGRASRNKITLFPQTPPGLGSPISWPSKGRATLRGHGRSLLPKNKFIARSPSMPWGKAFLAVLYEREEQCPDEVKGGQRLALLSSPQQLQLGQRNCSRQTCLQILPPGPQHGRAPLQTQNGPRTPAHTP